MRSPHVKENQTPALHQHLPLDRFDHRAADYVKYRPSYPAGAIDCILQGLDQPVAADLGAGTGDRLPFAGRSGGGAGSGDRSPTGP